MTQKIAPAFSAYSPSVDIKKPTGRWAIRTTIEAK